MMVAPNPDNTRDGVLIRFRLFAAIGGCNSDGSSVLKWDGAVIY